MRPNIQQGISIFTNNPADGQFTTQQVHGGFDGKSIQAAVDNLLRSWRSPLVPGSGNPQSLYAGVPLVSSGPPSEDANEARAIRGLLNNGSLITNSNGAIGNVELQAAANGTLPGMSNLSPEQQAELKSSAQYYLDHDDRFKQMETIQGAPADGACNVDDLMMRAQALPSSRRFSGKNFGAANMVAGASSRDIQGANNPVDADEVAAIRGLLNNRSLITNSNGAIGNVELQAAANGTLPGMSDLSPEQQAELKSSAQYYLDHDDRFKQMETIQGAPADGACNVDDLILRGQALTIKPASRGNDHIL